MARVLLSVPTFDGTVRSETDEAIGNLDRCGNEVIHANVSGYGIAHARNMMVGKAIDLGCDYLLMVDSDVIPPENALASLLSRRTDFCAGWYPKGTDETMTNIVKTGTLYFRECYSVDEMSGLSGLVEAKGTGMGCALVRVAAISAMKRPWFEFVDYQDGTVLGEDYFFCQRMRGYGLKVYVDADVACRHVHARVLG